MERIGHTSAGVALRYQHVMADRQAALAAALDGLAQEATKTEPRARSGHDPATTKNRVQRQARDLGCWVERAKGIEPSPRAWE
jgi:hypothetical protein